MVDGHNRTQQAPIHPLGYESRTRVRLRSRDRAERLYEAAEPHLLSFRGSSRNGPVTGATVHLGTLQRMCLQQLQAELAEVVSDICYDQRATEDTMDHTRQLLSKFTNSLRDYDYMTEQKAEARRSGKPDPFEISTRQELGRYLLEPLIAQQLERRRLGAELRRPVDEGEVQKGVNILPGTARGATNEAARRRLFVRSLATGILGGLALILPLLIMVLIRGLTVALIVASTATILFAAGLAFFTEMQPENIMGAVAAYAAVYVVFVGTRT
ncbi:hypothetical protein EDD36DRAFT_426303 [Exophiala viscosa]|uniref:DUF6594 domain-containing protein n=1 Tax=Exophiala viscosa TaxID=2486360 RepID=A0AAN6II16_9EURO|nr:hypothetical protein EDD36DRAFT_426303 [Exophiala viscosa]